MATIITPDKYISEIMALIRVRLERTFAWFENDLPTKSWPVVFALGHFTASSLTSLQPPQQAAWLTDRQCLCHQVKTLSQLQGSPEQESFTQKPSFLQKLTWFQFSSRTEGANSKNSHTLMRRGWCSKLSFPWTKLCWISSTFSSQTRRDTQGTGNFLQNDLRLGVFGWWKGLMWQTKRFMHSPHRLIHNRGQVSSIVVLSTSVCVNMCVCVCVCFPFTLVGTFDFFLYFSLAALITRIMVIKSRPWRRYESWAHFFPAHCLLRRRALLVLDFQNRELCHASLSSPLPLASREITFVYCQCLPQREPQVYFRPLAAWVYFEWEGSGWTDPIGSRLQSSRSWKTYGRETEGAHPAANVCHHHSSQSREESGGQRRCQGVQKRRSGKMCKFGSSSVHILGEWSSTHCSDFSFSLFRNLLFSVRRRHHKKSKATKATGGREETHETSGKCLSAKRSFCESDAAIMICFCMRSDAHQ